LACSKFNLIYLATSVGGFQGSTATVQSIKNEIMANGPVVASMMAYSDFVAYKSGVYFVNSKDVNRTTNYFRGLQMPKNWKDTLLK